MNGRTAAGLGLLVVLAGVVPVAVAPAAAQETVDCSFPVTVTDATGTSVTVQDRPERIVALAPSAAQQLWAIGARDRVVGMPVNEYTAYLDAREGVTNVYGDDGQPVPEEVVGLQPDLVLAPNVVRNDTVATLREAGLTVYRFDEARAVPDVYAEIERTGRLVGEFEAAAAVSAEMAGTADAVRDAVADRDRPRVYYDLGGGWTAGNATFVGDLVAMAGGDNIADEASIERYDPISQEVIASADPEVLVVHEGSPVPRNPAVNNSTAMRTGNVVRVQPNFINQPGPRNVEPLRAMAEGFHPEAMANASLDAAATPTPARCAGSQPSDASPTSTASTTAATAAPETTEPTDGADGAGFTLLAPVVAVLMLAVIGRCR